MIESLGYVFSALRSWIYNFGYSASVGYGYLADYLFTIVIVIVLLSFIKRLV